MTYRVQGLPGATSEEKLQRMVLNQLTQDEQRLLRPHIEMIPSCIQPDESSALLAVQGVPCFLRALSDDPLDSVSIEVNGNDFVFDSCFHGLTQLYKTQQGREINAE